MSTGTNGVLSTMEKTANGDTDALAALSISDLNTNVNHEPRLLDLRVAERLGYSRLRDVRAIIEKHQAELESYGTLVCANTPQTSVGGRPGRTYWLNEAQTLLICMFSKTERAALVRKEVVEVYMAWRRGETPRQPYPAADERNQRKAFALIDRLKGETNPSLRATLHDMLTQTLSSMELATPPLSEIGRAASPEPDILIPFWRDIRDLEANGIRLNHAHNPDLIALRLRDVRDEFSKSQVHLPHSKTLRDALKEYRSPRFVAIKTVNSAIERRAVKCWVFEGWHVTPKAGA